LKFTFLLSLCAFGLIFAVLPNADAAVDMFLKIDGVEGESTDKEHAGEIEILAWSWGMSNPSTTVSGGSTGKVVIQDISFTKYIDKSSPMLFLKVCNGKSFPEATLVVRKAGSNSIEFKKITMTNVLVTSVSMGGSGGEDRLTENITLNFAKVTTEYTEQDSTGKAVGMSTFEWNIIENTGSGGSEKSSGPAPEEDITEPTPEEDTTEPTSEEDTTEPTPEEVITEPTPEEDTTEPTPEERDTADEISRLPASEVAKLSKEKLAMITPRVFKELTLKTVRNFSPDIIKALPEDTKASWTPKQLKKFAPSTIREFHPELIEKLPALSKQILSPRIDQFPMKIPKSTILQQGIPGQERYAFNFPKLFIAPHAQLLAGVSAEDVICNEGFELLLKISTGKSVCVLSSSVDKLIERGFAQPLN